MQSEAKSPEEYIDSLPEERKLIIRQLQKVLLENLPKGFQEVMCYGMLGYVVPHSIYPKGYHCDSNKPLPFISIASQKNFIAFYHMGIYGDKNLYDWFVSEFQKHSNSKLDMGKSCVRFKKTDVIPYGLLAELVAKISVDDWISQYENHFKK
jgi:hypothetical protein